ncbi:DNA adenine methylase [Aeromonas veronii]|uniref:DNA adenine methylase n=1 Tax=Aeromonas veronii TaxID=654 RepID=UPI0024416FE4|nr:DNA adenine methylase [Aeromonas veronii]
MPFYTPLRYPGGKGKLAYYIKSMIEENGLLDGSYIEPYAGGASVALELLLEEYVQKITINDIDPAIYSFWHSVINESNELCELIRNVKINMDTWCLQKEIISDPSKYDSLSVGFATFFLNRTNRSGILKAGVIGGKNQTGNWKLDVRFNKDDLIQRIKRISKYRSRINILNIDTLQLIESREDLFDDRTLVYLDPPYYVKGQGLYRNYYSHNDHVNIMKALSNSRIKNWLVSYDSVDEINDIYKEYRREEYSLQYTAQHKKQGKEVMIYSPNIKIPSSKLGK